MASKMREWAVEVTIAEDRRLTVRAHTAEEAKKKAGAGKILRVGRPLKRGILIVGDAYPRDRHA